MAARKKSKLRCIVGLCHHESVEVAVQKMPKHSSELPVDVLWQTQYNRENDCFRSKHEYFNHLRLIAGNGTELSQFWTRCQKHSVPEGVAAWILTCHIVALHALASEGPLVLGVAHGDALVTCEGAL